MRNAPFRPRFEKASASNETARTTVRDMVGSPYNKVDVKRQKLQYSFSAGVRSLAGSLDAELRSRSLGSRSAAGC